MKFLSSGKLLLFSLTPNALISTNSLSLQSQALVDCGISWYDENMKKLLRDKKSNEKNQRFQRVHY